MNATQTAAHPTTIAQRQALRALAATEPAAVDAKVIRQLVRRGLLCLNPKGDATFTRMGAVLVLDLIAHDPATDRLVRRIEFTRVARECVAVGLLDSDHIFAEWARRWAAAYNLPAPVAPVAPAGALPF